MKPSRLNFWENKRSRGGNWFRGIFSILSTKNTSSGIHGVRPMSALRWNNTFELQFDKRGERILITGFKDPSSVASGQTFAPSINNNLRERLTRKDLRGAASASVAERKCGGTCRTLDGYLIKGINVNAGWQTTVKNDRWFSLVLDRRDPISFRNSRLH